MKNIQKVIVFVLLLTIAILGFFLARKKLLENHQSSIAVEAVTEIQKAKMTRLETGNRDAYSPKVWMVEFDGQRFIIVSTESGCALKRVNQ